jgi:hypothetical protein
MRCDARPRRTRHEGRASYVSDRSPRQVAHLSRFCTSARSCGGSPPPGRKRSYCEDKEYRTKKHWRPSVHVKIPRSTSRKYESAVTVEPQAGQRDNMRDNGGNRRRKCTDAREGGGRNEGDNGGTANNGGDMPGGGSGIRSRAGDHLSEHHRSAVIDLLGTLRCR